MKGLSKDQGYGFGILLVSIIVAILYLVAFFAPWISPLQMYGAAWHELAVGIPVLLFVLLVLVISAWIGYTMLTTPPPAPLEPEPSPEASEVKESKTEKPKPRTRRKR